MFICDNQDSYLDFKATVKANVAITLQERWVAVDAHAELKRF